MTIIKEDDNPWRPDPDQTETGSADSPESSFKNSHTAARFAFQFSPLGVEVGTALAAYAEGGIGVLGSLVVGLRYHF